ncbi:hypothetical protein ACJX0J_010783, partial [Zea mays]
TLFLALYLDTKLNLHNWRRNKCHFFRRGKENILYTGIFRNMFQEPEETQSILRFSFTDWVVQTTSYVEKVTLNDKP